MISLRQRFAQRRAASDADETGLHVPFRRVMMDPERLTETEQFSQNVDDMVAVIKAGWTHEHPDLPPVIAFGDENQAEIADGHHRVEAAKRAGASVPVLLIDPAVINDVVSRTDAIFSVFDQSEEESRQRKGASIRDAWRARIAARGNHRRFASADQDGRLSPCCVEHPLDMKEEYANYLINFKLLHSAMDERSAEAKERATLTDDLRVWSRAPKNQDDRVPSIVLAKGTVVEILRKFRLDHGGNPELLEIRWPDQSAGGTSGELGQGVVRASDFQFVSKSIIESVPEENVQCEGCGRSDLPLHTDGRCPGCSKNAPLDHAPERAEHVPVMSDLQRQTEIDKLLDRWQSEPEARPQIEEKLKSLRAARALWRLRLAAKNADGLVKPATPTAPTASTSYGSFIARSGNFYDLGGSSDHLGWVEKHMGDTSLPGGWVRVQTVSDIGFEFASDPTPAQWSAMTKVVLSAEGHREFFVENNAGSWTMDRTATVEEFRRSGKPLQQFCASVKYSDLSKKADAVEDPEQRALQDRVLGQINEDEIAASGIAAKVTDFVWSLTRINPRDTNFGKDPIADTKQWLDEESAEYLEDMGEPRLKGGERAQRREIERNPVVVIKGDDGVLWVLDGNHRTAQAMVLGLESIPALVGVKKPGIGKTPISPDYHMGSEKNQGAARQRLGWRQRRAGPIHTDLTLTSDLKCVARAEDSGTEHEAILLAGTKITIRNGQTRDGLSFFFSEKYSRVIIGSKVWTTNQYYARTEDIEAATQVKISVVDADTELDRLKQMLDSGEITREQFNSRAKRLYGSRKNQGAERQSLMSTWTRRADAEKKREPEPKKVKRSPVDVLAEAGFSNPQMLVNDIWSAFTKSGAREHRDHQITSINLTGSRWYGKAQEGSDLDVVVFHSGQTLMSEANGRFREMVSQATGGVVDAFLMPETESWDHPMSGNIMTLTSASSTPAWLRAANDPLKKIIEINGVKVGIEWPKGSTRTWKHLPGNDYEKLMKADYGYIRGTEGEDGEEIDVYAGPDRDSDLAFVVTQLDKKTGEYDEDKIMLGYSSEAEAKSSYLHHMEKAHFGGIKALSWEKFLAMVPKKQRVEKKDDAEKNQGEERQSLLSAWKKKAGSNPDRDQAMFDFQDSTIEPLPKQLQNFEESNQLGIRLENAGDIFRELVWRDDPDPGYIGEKVEKIRRHLTNPQMTQEMPDQAMAIMAQIASLFESVDTAGKSPLFLAARDLNIALARQDMGRAATLLPIFDQVGQQRVAHSLFAAWVDRQATPHQDPNEVNVGDINYRGTPRPVWVQAKDLERWLQLRVDDRIIRDPAISAEFTALVQRIYEYAAVRIEPNKNIRESNNISLYPDIERSLDYYGYGRDEAKHQVEEPEAQDKLKEAAFSMFEHYRVDQMEPPQAADLLMNMAVVMHQDWGMTIDEAKTKLSSFLIEWGGGGPENLHLNSLRGRWTHRLAKNDEQKLLRELTCIVIGSDSGTVNEAVLPKGTVVGVQPWSNDHIIFFYSPFYSRIIVRGKVMKSNQYSASVQDFRAATDIGYGEGTGYKHGPDCFCDECMANDDMSTHRCPSCGSRECPGDGHSIDCRKPGTMTLNDVSTETRDSLLDKFNRGEIDAETMRRRMKQIGSSLFSRWQRRAGRGGDLKDSPLIAGGVYTVQRPITAIRVYRGADREADLPVGTRLRVLSESKSGRLNVEVLDTAVPLRGLRVSTKFYEVDPQALTEAVRRDQQSADISAEDDHRAEAPFGDVADRMSERVWAQVAGDDAARKQFMDAYNSVNVETHTGGIPALDALTKEWVAKTGVIIPDGMGVRTWDGIGISIVRKIEREAERVQIDQKVYDAELAGKAEAEQSVDNGEMTPKRYLCRGCGDEKVISTNHWGDVYEYCSNSGHHQNYERGPMAWVCAGAAAEPKVPGLSDMTIDDVQTVNPEDELSRLLKMKDSGEITEQQFNDKAKRLYGARLPWLLRRAASSETILALMDQIKQALTMGPLTEEGIERMVTHGEPFGPVLQRAYRLAFKRMRDTGEIVQGDDGEYRMSNGFTPPKVVTRSDPHGMSRTIIPEGYDPMVDAEVMSGPQRQKQVDALLDQYSKTTDPEQRQILERKIREMSASASDRWLRLALQALSRVAGDQIDIAESRSPGAVKDCGHHWPGKTKGQRGWCGRCGL